MYRIKEKIILIAFTCMSSYLSAQNLHSVKDSHHIYNVNKSHTIYDVKDSVKIFFRQGKIDLDPILNDNQSALNRIAETMRNCYADSIYQLRKILVVGVASPEGTLKFNKWLSRKRADVLFSYLSQYSTLPDSLKTSSFFCPDWKGLIQMVKNDSQLPFREETLSLLNRIAGEAETEKEILKQEKHLELIKNLRGGIPYHYMYKKYFPALRFSQLFLWYDKVQKPQIPDSIPKWENVKQSVDTVSNTDSIYIEPSPIRKPFYMAMRTNMLFDVLLLPNIGLEFYLGKRWSVAANWMYGWWNNDRRNWYWRAYGGDIAIRKWLGKAAEEKTLTGHHIGIYTQIFTYDFETGDRGYMGGKPGGAIWNKMNYAMGAEYGYSLPIARKLNIDFTLGVGYWGGIYHEYKPQAGYYVWKATKERRWIGPTKAEISLVWLLGRGNSNRKWKRKSEMKEESPGRMKKDSHDRKKEDSPDRKKKGGADE